MSLIPAAPFRVPKRAGNLTDGAVIWYTRRMKRLMQSRTVTIVPVTLIAVFLCAGPLAAQQLNVSRNQEPAHEVYAPSVTAAVYLVNFLLLYMANPGLSAYMPAYKAPIPQAIVDCLDQNPTGTGCAYADYRRYLDEQTFTNGECFWPTVCQESPRWASLAPRKVTQRQQLNEPLGRRRADQLARLLGIEQSMILTDAEYHCVIGPPGGRTHDQQINFDCI